MRVRSLAVAIMGSLFAATAGVAATADADSKMAQDPFLWLEEVDGARAMEWVRAENAKTAAVLDNDPRYASLFKEALEIAQAKDRIPRPRFIGGQILNDWQDADHIRGIWRRTSLEDYRTPGPAWTTILDLDVLATAENANWFWGGADCEEPSERHCMLRLSDGGEDAVTLREFDLRLARFVDNGFALPRGKQNSAWESHETLLVAREWKPGELTRSGYPFVVKRIERGQPLSAAVEVFRGSPEDVAATPLALNDATGHRAVMIERRFSFFETEYRLVGRPGTTKLALPSKADIEALVAGRLIVSLKQDWKLGGGKVFRQGCLVSIDLAAAAAQPKRLRPTLVYVPGPREAFVDEA